MSRIASLLAALAFLALPATHDVQAAEDLKAFGCFKARASLKIRARPFSTADIVATAAAGEVLQKRKRWCTVRGYWCAVRTQNGVVGYADKAFIEKTDCP